MLEKPHLSDEILVACIEAEYGLAVSHIAFLPLGNDLNTAVYRVDDDATTYFLKLRRADFVETSVTIPHFLYEQGITQIIAPLTTHAGQLWTLTEGFTVILYPFVTGLDAFEVDLTDQQRIELGVALKAIHTANVPPSLRDKTPHENYTPHWRNLLSTFQARVEHTPYTDSSAAQLAEHLRTRRAEISHIVARAAQLGNLLCERSLDEVLCHADLHAGNLLIGAGGALHIVDWDTAIFAPKECDLMFIGGGVDWQWTTAREEALFYQGYGPAQIDMMALTYYRYERIVQDIAVTCEQLLLTDAGGADREIGLQNFLNQFLPNGVVEIADKTDKMLLAA